MKKYQAKEAAKRGEYEHAWKLLDEALALYLKQAEIDGTLMAAWKYYNNAGYARCEQLEQIALNPALEAKLDKPKLGVPKLMHEIEENLRVARDLSVGVFVPWETTAEYYSIRLKYLQSCKVHDKNRESEIAVCIDDAFRFFEQATHRGMPILIAHAQKRTPWEQFKEKLSAEYPTLKYALASERYRQKLKAYYELALSKWVIPAPQSSSPKAASS